jgi:hypothetical protein
MAANYNATDVEYSRANGARLLSFFVASLVMIFVDPLSGALALAVLLVLISLLEGD